jgi:gliding motility-associated-like protein
MEVSGIYIAQGGERFITIGNFRDGIATNLQATNFGIGQETVYYYLDDVSVWYCDEDESVSEDLFVPNAFSPNGDGLNDYFVIQGIEQYPDNELYIYNRWGELVYYKSKYDNSFTGESNTQTLFGKTLTEGTYFYVFRTGKENKSYSGFLELGR